MKFVINTNYKAAGTIVLDGLVKRLSEATRNVWDNYRAYDVALFMAPDSEIRKAKQMNPKILAGIFDPKVTLSRQREEARAADFLIVSSIEQRDFFLKYNKNVFIYYMFPDIPVSEKIHVEKKKIVIGYHGNKQHLDAMVDASWALDELAKTYDIELRAIYNVDKLGRWTQNCPKICKVKHIQWEEGKFLEDLKECDIGIAPSALPAPKLFARPFRAFFSNPESYVKNDYVLRFKMSNNSGRIYVFSQLGIPVVADFTPSACQIIQDKKSGLLVGTKEGWKHAIESLIKNPELRNEYSRNLKKNIEMNYSIDQNFNDLIKNISSLYE